MTAVLITLTIKTKWWFTPALYLGLLALRLGLIRDADSAEHWGGRITAEERLMRWLSDYAFRVEAGA